MLQPPEVKEAQPAQQSSWARNLKIGAAAVAGGTILAVTGVAPEVPLSLHAKMPNYLPAAHAGPHAALLHLLLSCVALCCHCTMLMATLQLSGTSFVASCCATSTHSSKHREEHNYNCVHHTVCCMLVQTSPAMQAKLPISAATSGGLPSITAAPVALPKRSQWANTERVCWARHQCLTAHNTHQAYPNSDLHQQYSLGRSKTQTMLQVGWQRQPWQLWQAVLPPPLEAAQLRPLP